MHEPEPGSFRSGCGGYVIAGEQSCYINSYEPVLLLLILLCMSVSGFYLRMPPGAFLLQVRVGTGGRGRLRATARARAIPNPIPNPIPNLIPNPIPNPIPNLYIAVADARRSRRDVDGGLLLLVT